jgi:hypothetical protein
VNRIRIPPMLAALVQTGFTAVDGMEFSRLDACPACGGELSGYDTKERKFGTLATENGDREIRVRVKRYQCRQCGTVSPARSPFYPDTRLGSPVVDLCIVLSQSMPCTRAARVMREIGIVIDRGTVQNYAERTFGPIATTEMFGLKIPRSLISLSVIGTRPR